MNLLVKTCFLCFIRSTIRQAQLSQSSIHAGIRSLLTWKVLRCTNASHQDGGSDLEIDEVNDEYEYLENRYKRNRRKSSIRTNYEEVVVFRGLFFLSLLGALFGIFVVGLDGLGRHGASWL
jgi:hypothetical protein